jgi:hypothetical protein
MAVVVDRMSVEIVQANLLWGVIGGLVGALVGLLGIFGLIIGIIALALSWFWGKTSSRTKMLLFGMGLVAIFVGLFTTMMSATTTALGLTPTEVSGVGWFGTILSIPQRVNTYIGFDQALLNTTVGVPTSAGATALSRLTGAVSTATTGGGGGGTTG